MEGRTKQTLVDCLRAFNRKERYWLLRNALGENAAEPRLSASFVANLRKTLPIEVPDDAWWAMDYHFDWLIGAAFLFAGSELVGPNPAINGPSDKPGKLAIQGNQEDIDLVVAFDNTIILIEAKALHLGEPLKSNPSGCGFTDSLRRSAR